MPYSLENLLLNTRHSHRAWVLSLLVAVALVYLPFLGNPFVFDDQRFFSSNVSNYYATSLFHFDLRGLPYASLAWTVALFSNAVPHFFHLGNALLHAGNVILLFYLLRQLMSTTRVSHDEHPAVVCGAWFGALIFAWHPVAVYAVGYVIQRSILMATLFALIMQLAYIRGLLTGQKRWLVLAVLAYLLAGFSKEHSVMLPAVLAVMTFLFRTKNQLNKHALWATWTGFIAIGLLLVLRAKGVFGTPYEAMAAQLFEQQGIVESSLMLQLLSALTQAGFFFKYLFLWLVPNPVLMSVDMREHFVTTWTAWQGWGGALGFILYGLVGIKLLLRRGRQGLAGLALLYPWLLFWVEFSSIRVQEPFVLYRSYLWMPGMMLLFPLLATRWPSRKAVLALGSIAILLVPLAWNRLWVFGDNYRLWNDAALLLPNEKIAGANRIFYNRGQASAALHKWDAAAKDFQRVVAISPELAPVRYELGMAFVNLKLNHEAIKQFDAGIAIDPNDARLFFGKGLSLMQLHEKEQAHQQMKKACEQGYDPACMIAGWMQNKS